VGLETPLPPRVAESVPLDIKFLDASVSTICDAVRLDELNVVPLTVVVAAIEPGAINVLGVDNVTAPEDALAVISFAVPAILVTVADDKLVHVIGLVEPPADVKTYPDVPAVIGRLKLYVPAAA
jgi:hypothetical protein